MIHSHFQRIRSVIQVFSSHNLFLFTKELSMLHLLNPLQPLDFRDCLSFHLAGPSLECQGISYCPVPVKTVTSLSSDDWMTDVAKPLWSAAGRGDLQIMHAMGANAVPWQVKVWIIL